MQVNDPTLQQITPGTSGIELTQVTAGEPKTKGGLTEPSGSDAVELSSFAKHIGDLQEGSPAREARVAELREQVQSGKYEVDAEAVARKMIDEAFDG